MQARSHHYPSQYQGSIYIDNLASIEKLYIIIKYDYKCLYIKIIHKLESCGACDYRDCHMHINMRNWIRVH